MATASGRGSGTAVSAHSSADTGISTRPASSALRGTRRSPPRVPSLHATRTRTAGSGHSKRSSARSALSRRTANSSIGAGCSMTTLGPDTARSPSTLTAVTRTRRSGGGTSSTHDSAPTEATGMRSAAPTRSDTSVPGGTGPAVQGSSSPSPTAGGRQAMVTRPPSACRRTISSSTGEGHRSARAPTVTPRDHTRSPFGSR